MYAVRSGGIEGISRNLRLSLGTLAACFPEKQLKCLISVPQAANRSRTGNRLKQTASPVMKKVLQEQGLTSNPPSSRAQIPVKFY